MQSVIYKFTELLLLFILLPISLVFNYALYLKILFVLLGFVYVVWILLKIEKQQFSIGKSLPWKEFWRNTFILLGIIMVLTSLYVYFTDATKLFVIVRTKPLWWICIVFLYSLFSVYPQELIYRTFFFLRYNTLIKQKQLFLLANAILFSLAHVFFKNTLVLILTFLGGILFAITFQKTRSTVLVTIEHAIYGSWLFTVGMGEMLGFPNE